MDDLVDYLKAWETFVPIAINDNPQNPDKGHWEFGYGFDFYYHTPVKQGMVITQEEADSLLLWSIGRTQGLLGIYHLDTSSLTKNQYDGLISIAYNMGANAIPKLAQCLKIKDFSNAYLNFFDGINQSGIPKAGLIYRRACDAQIFKDNIYECRHWITKNEQDIFLKVNANNPTAIELIKNGLIVR